MGNWKSTLVRQYVYHETDSSLRYTRLHFCSQLNSFILVGGEVGKDETNNRIYFLVVEPDEDISGGQLFNPQASCPPPESLLFRTTFWDSHSKSNHSKRAGQKMGEKILIPTVCSDPKISETILPQELRTLFDFKEGDIKNGVMPKANLSMYLTKTTVLFNVEFQLTTATRTPVIPQVNFSKKSKN